MSYVPCLRPLPRVLTLCTAVLMASPAAAASYQIDGFDAPTPPSTNVLTSVASVSFNELTGTVPGGVRQVSHYSYINPLNSAVVLAIGNGQLSSSSGVQARTEVNLAYGASGPSGPRLGLDFRPYDTFHLVFTGVSSPLNIVIGLYTANPLNPSSPLYYSNAAVNVAPAVPGGPLTVDLPFTLGDPFNFAQVDGIQLVINRANGNTGISYNLDSFGVTTAVPEPTSALLLLAGVGLLGSRLRLARPAAQTAQLRKPQ